MLNLILHTKHNRASDLHGYRIVSDPCGYYVHFVYSPLSDCPTMPAATRVDRSFGSGAIIDRSIALDHMARIDAIRNTERQSIAAQFAIA